MASMAELGTGLCWTQRQAQTDLSGPCMRLWSTGRTPIEVMPDAALANRLAQMDASQAVDQLIAAAISKSPLLQQQSQDRPRQTPLEKPAGTPSVYRCNCRRVRHYRCHRAPLWHCSYRRTRRSCCSRTRPEQWSPQTSPCRAPRPGGTMISMTLPYPFAHPIPTPSTCLCPCIT